MSGLTPEQRASEEQRLVELAKELRDLSTSAGAEGHSETILGFAAEAEKFAEMINKAVTPELAAAFATKAAKKAAGWEELMQLLQVAQLVENPDDAEALQKGLVEEAEAKLRATATQLRGVSATGNTPVFRAIANIAASAEEGLNEFLAAETAEEKLQIFARVEESRARWLGQLEDMQSSLQDGSESQAPTEAPDARDAEVEEFQDTIEPEAEDPFERAWNAMEHMGAFTQIGLPGRSAANSAPVSIPKPAPPPKPTIKDAPLPGTGTPEEVQKQVAKYLQDGEEGFLLSLKNAVDKVKGDDSFEGVHEDAAKFLEKIQLAADVILTESLGHEALRKIQRAAVEAKKQAFTIQKYDLYKRTGKMPRLADKHVDLLQAAKIGVDLSEFLRKQSQEALMNSVAGMMAEVGAA